MVPITLDLRILEMDLTNYETLKPLSPDAIVATLLDEHNNVLRKF